MSEAMGKIVGMLMAYGVSSLGLFLAYANYRRRTVGADRIMTPRAWMVIAAVFAALAAGGLVVSQLAEMPQDPVAREAAVADPQATEAPPSIAESAAPDSTAATSPGAPTEGEERPRWPVIGIVVPASIFLFATWVTTALHQHFTGDGQPGR
ncbi:MAG: hypothetical protein AAGM22_08920 [Acidobacteriota bacterium]